jgi:hypothetical protein
MKVLDEHKPWPSQYISLSNARSPRDDEGLEWWARLSYGSDDETYASAEGATAPLALMACLFNALATQARTPKPPTSWEVKATEAAHKLNAKLSAITDEQWVEILTPLLPRNKNDA